MNAQPTWTETRPGNFKLTVREGADFGVYQDGRDFLLVLPGHGIKRCWNMAEAERWAVNFVEDYADEEPREDEDAADRSYSEARRFERAATPVRL